MNKLIEIDELKLELKKSNHKLYNALLILDKIKKNINKDIELCYGALSNDESKMISKKEIIKNQITIYQTMLKIIDGGTNE